MKLLILIPLFLLMNISNSTAQLPAAYYDDFELLAVNNLFKISYKVKQDKLYKVGHSNSYVEYKFILTFYIEGRSPAELKLEEPLIVELEVAAGKETKKIEIPLKAIIGSQVHTYRVSILATETPFAKALTYKIDYGD